jgi:hypothetical protein
MDKEQLSELAKNVMDLLKQYDIEAQRFNLKILVSREYYQSIKNNFPDRHPVDLIVGSSEENWGIDLLYSLYSPGGVDPDQSQ